MADLAATVGIHRSYLNKIEVEERDVSPEVYKSLLRALGIRDHRALLRVPADSAEAVVVGEQP